jgi:hypothetical protein
MTDFTKENYNKFEYLPEIPYRIVAYLIDNSDLIWRLLSDNSPNAWKLDSDHPNLTKVQKGALIYDGLKTETSCRVFLDQGQDESWQQEVCILRISVAEAIPTNYVWGYVSVFFEIYPHYRINNLSNYQTRSLMISQQLISILNGTDLGKGIGKLYFDTSKNSRSRLALIGKSPYKGVGLLMSNHAL